MTKGCVSISKGGKQSEEAATSTGSGNADSELMKKVTTLSLAVEKLQAESQANKEVRQATNERFSRISEQIGELRNQLRQSEKARLQMETKVEKAVGLVEAVQPQKLMSAVSKTDVKIEAVKSKIDALDLINSKIKEDLRDVRNKFAVFRNLKMVKDMNEDSKKRFRDMRKIEATVIQKADKLDNLFSEFEGAIEANKQTSKELKDVSDSVRKLFLNLDKLKASVDSKASSQDVSGLKAKLNDAKQEVLDKTLKDLEYYKKQMKKDIESDVKKDEVKLVHQLVSDDFKELESRLKKLENVKQ
ncbi:MAG: hypothetical protein ACLFNB_04725 [Candidatus Woesearchaeota archaeon]